MKEKIVSFCWQHLLLLLSLFVMTVGVAVCVRSMLGSSVIWVQLFQLVIGFLFGMLIDVNMRLTSWLMPVGLWQQALAQATGCTLLGIGIALEVRCGSVTMPGE